MKALRILIGLILIPITLLMWVFVFLSFLVTTCYDIATEEDPDETISKNFKILRDDIKDSFKILVNVFCMKKLQPKE